MLDMIQAAQRGIAGLLVRLESPCTPGHSIVQALWATETCALKPHTGQKQVANGREHSNSNGNARKMGPHNSEHLLAIGFTFAVIEGNDDPV